MHPLVRTTRRLLVGATSIYCVGLIVLALLWAIGIRGIWWVDLTNIFALHLFAPFLLLGPLAMLVPSRWLRRAIVVAGIVFLALFGNRLVPPPEKQARGAPLHVATFNLHYSLTDPQVAGSIAAIRAQQADVVALQELSIPAAIAIQQQLAKEYPYQALAPSESYTGLGLIGRYPLTARRLASNMGAQLALIQMDDQQITFINASLTSPAIKMRRLPLIRRVKGLPGYRTTQRSREIELLLRAIDDVRGPLVVAGDFNLSDREPDYARFAERLRDAYRETNWGFGYTYPSSHQAGGLSIPVPLIRIDYVWSAGGIVSVGARVACTSSSDHCMVVADVRVETVAMQPPLPVKED
jgi:endonuclease/exonuclease/phosphatase (EEP) superfamily protein YafD